MATLTHRSAGQRERSSPVPGGGSLSIVSRRSLGPRLASTPAVSPTAVAGIAMSAALGRLTAGDVGPRGADRAGDADRAQTALHLGPGRGGEHDTAR